MSESEVTVTAALSTLAGRGAITMPVAVTETAERGHREQLIDGRQAAANNDPEFWESAVDRDIESFVRMAQQLADSLAIRDYFRTAEPSEGFDGLAARIRAAADSCSLGPSGLAWTTGIEVEKINDILSGARAPKIPELIVIARETKVPMSQMLGMDTAARMFASANGPEVEQLRNAVLGFADISAHLDDHAIPRG